MMNAFVENVRRKIKVPTPKKSDKPKRKSKKKATKEPESTEPGVVYIGHIPHGFYEKEMRAYFSQFGDIRRLRVARSRKSGGAKGFAYIEFESQEVAKVVADTMNNYLFFEKLLKCEYMPREKVHPDCFKGWSLRMPLKRDKNRSMHNKEKSEADIEKSKEKRFKRLQKLRSSLKESGITLKINSFKPSKSEKD